MCVVVTVLFGVCNSTVIVICSYELFQRLVPIQSSHMFECDYRYGTTNNCDSPTELCTLNTTVTAAYKVFSVFTRLCLIFASNGGHSPSSGFLKCPRPQLPTSHNCNSQLIQPTNRPYTALAWTAQKMSSIIVCSHCCGNMPV
jgi:hypothetical protein